MFKKYLFLSFLVFANLYSMEDNSNLNEETALLHSKFKEIKVNKNVNKNKKTLLILLPRDIWLFILSFLDYKDNRKAFINFWAQVIELDDLTIKRISIDIYRSVILNSKNLYQWKALNNNACKSWKNKENKEIVLKYLNVLNKNFKEQIKNYDPSLVKRNIDFKSLWKNETNNLIKEYGFIYIFNDNFEDAVGVCIEEDINMRKLDCINAMLDLKKFFLIITKFEDSFFVKHNLGTFKFFLAHLVLSFVIPMVLFFIFGNIKVIVGVSVGFFTLALPVACFALSCCLYKSDKTLSVKNSIGSIIEKLKANKIDIFESDNYFLELLGHKFEKDLDILELEDVDLKSNGKQEALSEEDLSIV